MADVSIDAAISTSTARGKRALVFVSATQGYAFYIDSTGGLVRSKTTDGGATWGAAAALTSGTSTVAFDVWYDQWTPGDSGNIIHIWQFDTLLDDIEYSQLRTSDDFLVFNRGQVISLTSAVAGVNAFISGTKTRSGYLYVVAAIDASAEMYFGRSTDGGTTWSADLDSGRFFLEANPDHGWLFPATGTGDNNDCFMVYQDSSALALTVKMWDNSGSTFFETATIQTNIAVGTDLTVYQYPISAAVRHSDGHLIIVSMNNRDTATTNMQVYDVTGTASVPTWTTKTNITTNIDDNYNPQIFIDQATNNLYVAYNGKKDGSEVLGTTTKIYYVKSTDGGTTWSAELPYQEGATAAALQVWAPLSGPRFYVTWRVGTTLVGNAVNSISFAAGVYTLTCTQGAYALTGQAAILARSRIMSNVQGAYALSGQAVLLNKGKLMSAVQGSYLLGTTIVDDFYSETNRDSGDWMYTGYHTGFGQTFTSNGGRLSSCKFWLGRGASATGNVFAKLYSVSAGLPNTLLATSDAVGVATGVPVAAALVQFAFSGAQRYDLTAGIGYVITVEFSGGSSTSDGVFVGFDGSSGTHPGVLLVKNGIWATSLPGWDGVFYVYVSGPAISFRRTYRVVPVQGVYALSGQPTNLLRKRSMVTVQGAYAYTGFVANLLRGWRLAAAQGVYSGTGFNVNHLLAHKIVALQGAYSYVGSVTNFLKGKTLTAVQGSYVLSGIVTLFKWGHKAITAQGVYSVNGVAANLLRGSRLVTVFGSYVLTGIVTLLRKAFRLPTVQGGYAINGQAANLLFGHRLSLNVGFYVLTGPDVTLVKGTQRILTASFGTYSVAGQPTILLWKHVIPAAQGAYTYTGRTSNLLRGSRLTSGQGAYSYNGVSANLLSGRKLGTIQGVYIYTGQSAILFKGRFVTASQGSYVRTGFASNLLWKRIVAATQGGYLLSGVSANFPRGRRVTTIQGAYVLTGEPANLVRTAVKTIFASQGAYALVGQPSNMLWKRKMTLVQGTYIYTGSLVSLLKGRTMSGTFGLYNLTGQPSAFRQSRVMPTNVGSYSLTGFPVLFHHPPAPLFGVTGMYVLSGFDVTFSINEITFFYYIDLTQDENDPTESELVGTETESELVGTSSKSGGFKYVFP